jgi:hypothetical protein
MSMHEGDERRDISERDRDEGAGESRPQKGGEAATTRFGMEDGDNTDVPATGGVTAEEDGSEQPRKD